MNVSAPQGFIGQKDVLFLKPIGVAEHDSSFY